MNSSHVKLLSLTQALHSLPSSGTEKGGSLLRFRGNRPMAVVGLALLALFAFPLSPLQALDGTYTSTSGGPWNVAGSWSSAIASGSGYTANFNTLDLTTNLSLSLGADQTIGNLIFGDTAPSNHGWTITGNKLTLDGTTPTITVNDLGTGTATINSNIAGTAGLKKEGSGTLTLGGTNSYTGGTTISTGTLISTAGGSVRGNVSIASGAVWTVNAGTTSGVVHGLSGSGSLNGTGTVIVGGNNATSTFDGTIVMNTAGSSFTKIGSGTLTLTNTVSVNYFFTYQGGWTEIDLSKWVGGFHFFDGGNLRVTGANTTANDVQMRVNKNTTVDTNGHDTNFASLYVYNFSPYTLTKTGAGAMILDGTQTGNSGTPAIAINLEQGTLRSTASGAYSTGLLTMSAGTIFDLNGVADLTTINRGLNGTGTVTTTGTNRVTFAYGDFAGNIEAGSLYKNQSGTLTLSGTNGYTGSTTVAAGTLMVTGSLTDSSSYSISSGAKLQIGNDTATGSLNGSSIANAGTLEFKRSNALSFTNAISGAGAVVQNGSGVTTFSAVNTYTGSTQVNVGTLLVNGSIASSSGVSVAAGATLGGSGSVSAISGAGMIAPGNSPGILTAPSVDGTSGLDFYFEFMDLAPNYADASASENDVLRLTSGTPFVASLNSGNTVTVDFSSLSLSGGQTYYGGFYADAGDFWSSISGANFVFTGADGFTIAVSTVQQNAAFSGGSANGWVTQFDVFAIPEPSTTLLLTGGLMVVVILRRRSRRV